MNNKKISHAGETVGPQAQCETNPPQRILVADDDEDIRRLNIDILTLSGYRVDAAEDGAVAWDNLQRNNYDLLITDNNMPKVSGFELLKKLRAGRMALPVIMASGTLPAEEFMQSPWLQPTATLLKPFTSDELLGTVRKVLHATDNVRERSEPAQTWRSQPTSDDVWS